MSYVIRYRRPGQWFYRKLCLSSHQYMTEQDKLICFLKDGRVYELPEVTKTELMTGPDMAAAMRKAKENADAARAQVQDSK